MSLAQSFHSDRFVFTLDRSGSAARSETSECAVLLAAILVLNTFVPLANAAGNVTPGCGLVLFADVDFAGPSLVLEGNVTDLDAWSFNDVASSARVTGGAWTVFSDVGYAGQSRTFDDGDVAWFGSEMNDVISSASCVPDAPLPVVEGCDITLFSDWNLGGSSLRLRGDASSLIDHSFNDVTSSARVLDGTWRLFADVDYAGSWLEIGPGETTYVGDAFNDVVSSIQCSPTDATPPLPVTEGCDVSLFADASFTGAGLRLQANTSNFASHNFNDMASSVRVVAGVWTLFSDNDYGGLALTLNAGETPFVGESWNDQFSSARCAPEGTSSAPPGESPATTAPEPVVTAGCKLRLFAKSDFKGRSVIVEGNSTDLRTYDFNDVAVSARTLNGSWTLFIEAGFGGGSLRLGSGDAPSLGNEFSGGISSAACEPKVPAKPLVKQSIVPGEKTTGCEITLFEGEQGSGDSLTAYRTVARIQPALLGNAASAVVVSGAWTLFAETNFSGQSTVMMPGSIAPVGDGQGVVRSAKCERIIVGQATPGCELILFDGDASGRTIFLRGSVDDLRTFGFDDLASSARAVSGRWTLHPNARSEGTGVHVHVGPVTPLASVADDVSSAVCNPVTSATTTPGCEAILHDGKLSGNTIILTSSESDLALLEFSGFASSARVVSGAWTLYEAPSFGGRSIVIRAGAHKELPNFDNTAASARCEPVGGGTITTGCEMVVYEGHLAGASVTLKGNHADLATLDFASKAASVRVVSGTWTLFALPNLLGRAVSLTPASPSDLGTFAGVANSARCTPVVGPTVTAGCELILYDGRYTGNTIILNGNSADLSALGFQGLASSAKAVSGTWALFAAPNFQGQELPLRAGGSDTLGPMDDRSESASCTPAVGGTAAESTPGCEAILFSQRNQQGAPLRLKASAANLASFGFDDAAASARVLAGTWTIFAESGYAGSSRIVDASNADGFGRFFEQQVSSARCAAKAPTIRHFAQTIEECAPNCRPASTNRSADYHPLIFDVTKLDSADDLLITAPKVLVRGAQTKTGFAQSWTPDMSSNRLTLAERSTVGLFTAVATATGNIDGDQFDDVAYLDVGDWQLRISRMADVTLTVTSGKAGILARVDVPGGASPTSMPSLAVGDLDGDGRDEIAVATPTKLTLYKWTRNELVPFYTASSESGLLKFETGGNTTAEIRGVAIISSRGPHSPGDIALQYGWSQYRLLAQTTKYYDRGTSLKECQPPFCSLLDSAPLHWEAVQIFRPTIGPAPGGLAHATDGSFDFKGLKQIRKIDPSEVGNVREADAHVWVDERISTQPVKGLTGSYHLALLPGDYDGDGREELVVASEMFPQMPDGGKAGDVDNWQCRDASPKPTYCVTIGTDSRNDNLDGTSSDTRLYRFDDGAGAPPYKALSSKSQPPVSTTCAINDARWHDARHGREIENVTRTDRWIRSGDVDGDRHPDIVCANSAAEARALMSDGIQIRTYSGWAGGFTELESARISSSHKSSGSQTRAGFAGLDVGYFGHDPNPQVVALWGGSAGRLISFSYSLGTKHATTGVETPPSMGVVRLFAVDVPFGSRLTHGDYSGSAMTVQYAGSLSDPAWRSAAHVTRISQPTVVAVVAPPPYVEGAGQEPGDTSITLSRSECNEDETGKVFSAEWHAGIWGETTFVFPLIAVKLHEVSILGSVQESREESTSKSLCVEESTTWTSSGEEPGVVSKQTPIDSYLYRIVAAPGRPELVGAPWELVTLGRPATYMWPLSEYNAAVAEFNEALLDEVPTITMASLGDMIAGNLLSYPTRAVRDEIMDAARAEFSANDTIAPIGFTGFAPGEDLRKQLVASEDRLFIYNTSLAHVGNQPGTVTLSVVRNQESSARFGYELSGGASVDLRFGAGFGGQTGFSIMAGNTNAHSFTTGASRGFEASVNAITDPALFKAYGYDWGMFVYPHTVGTSVPVFVSYWVENYQPTGAPLARVREAAKLVDPAPGMTLQGGAPVTLRWQPAPNAYLYEVHVRQLGEALAPYMATFDVATSGPAAASPPPAPTTLTLTDLPAGGVFEWWVTAYDLAAAISPQDRVSNTFTTSETRRFAVLGDGVPVVMGVVAAKGDKSDGRSEYRVTWSAGTAYDAASTTRQHFQVSASQKRDPSAATKTIVVDALDASMTLPPGAWFVFVREVRGGIEGGWSAPFRVVTSKGPGVVEVTGAHREDGTLAPPLAWEEAPNATAYQLEWSRDGSARKMVTLRSAGWKPTPNALPSGTYEVRVRALSGEQAGAWSRPLTLDILSPPADAPFITPGNIQKTISGSNEPVFGLPFSWSAVTGATAYQVQSADVRTFDGAVTGRPQSATEWWGEALAGGTHWVRVRALNQEAPGPWSQPIVLALDPPPSIARLVATQRPDGTATIPVQWEAIPDAISYQVETQAEEGHAVIHTIRDPAWAPLGTLPAGTYTVRVRAVSPAGTGPWSPPIELLVKDAPREIPVLAATHASVTKSTKIGNVTVQFESFPISWAALPSATSYEVQAASSATFEGVVERAAQTETTWTSTTLAGGEYYVRVRGLNDDAAGEWSNAVAIFVEPKAATPGLGAIAIALAAAGVALSLRRRVR